MLTRRTLLAFALAGLPVVALGQSATFDRDPIPKPLKLRVGERRRFKGYWQYSWTDNRSGCAKAKFDMDDDALVFTGLKRGTCRGQVMWTTPGREIKKDNFVVEVD